MPAKKTEFRISVVFNPSYHWQPVGVSPDYAVVDNRGDTRDDSVRWNLDTAVAGAVLTIDFGSSSPFKNLNPINDTEWLGTKPKPQKGFFKYTVKVSYNGKDHTLDPVLIDGERP